jgi:hypothetical protein
MNLKQRISPSLLINKIIVTDITDEITTVIKYSHLGHIKQRSLKRIQNTNQR